MFTSQKMGAALAAGNCIVLKPTELAPLSTLHVGELMLEVGFPQGVVNILPGEGEIAGQHLAEHKDIGKISFTGSSANQGQACIAGSRLILHESIADEFLEQFVSLAKPIRLVNPLDINTELGPLTSKGHLDKVLYYCKVAKYEGAEILCGGKSQIIKSYQKVIL